MESKCEWSIAKPDEKLAGMLAREIDLSMTVARLLTIRGIKSLEQARHYLSCRLEDLTDPWLMSGMAEAVARINLAIDRNERTIIYGDYDADGVCSTVLLYQCLTRLGAQVEYYLPDRFTDGYGLNMRAVEKLAGHYSLLITVDNGISSYEEIKRGNELGLDIIISDHHTPPQEVPPALAIVNPRMDSLAANADLAGVGVVFQVCQALSRDRLSNEEVMSWLDIVALATVADAVPLTGDNRILVKRGLERMKETTNIGLRALIQASNLDNQELTAWHLAFILGPRINAAGRLKSASLVAEMLLSNNQTKAAELAADLCELNNQRRTVEEGVTQAAIALVENQVDLAEETVLVVGGEGWHQGVIGIVASRIAERYNRPAIIISWEGEEGKGSCRSLPGFDLHEALSSNASWLQHFGGHKLAAGLSIKRENFCSFRRAINAWSKEKEVGDYYQQRKQIIDLELVPDEINMALVHELKILEPYGEQNPPPCFIMRGIGLESYHLMGKSKEHFRCRAAGFDGVAFGRADFMRPDLSYLNQDMLFYLEENEFRGKRSIQLRIGDMKPSCSALGFYYHTPESEWLSSMMVLLQGQLEQGHNIIITYPTARLLSKQKILFKRLFLPGVVEELHGCMSYRSRLLGEARLRDNHIKVCLTTNSFLEYYLKKHVLDTKNFHIIQAWSAPERNNWAEMLQKYQHSVWHWVPRYRFQVQRDWKFKRDCRTYIYCNRPPTLRNLSQDVPGLYIEVGIDTPEKRDPIRQSFLARETGTLLSDGAYVKPFNHQDIDEMVFADLPFSEYEALSVLSQIAADRETTIWATFGEDAIDFNRRYLERSYPDGDLVKAVWKYLSARGQDQGGYSLDILAKEMKTEIGQGVSTLEIEAVLCILADLCLCEIEKKGSIMAIKLINTAAADFDLNNSPYYLEGLAEKKAFAAWLERLKELYAW